MTQEIDNLTLKKQLLKEWNDGNGTLGHYPLRSPYEFETAQNGPSIAVGGGFDWVVTRPSTWRIVNIEYTHSWMNDALPRADADHGLREDLQTLLRVDLSHTLRAYLGIPLVVQRCRWT